MKLSECEEVGFSHQLFPLMAFSSSRLWETCSAVQELSCDSFLYRKMESFGWWKFLPCLQAVLRQSVFSILWSVKRREKKRKRRKILPYVHPKYNSSQADVITPGIKLLSVFMKHSSGKSTTKFSHCLMKLNATLSHNWMLQCRIPHWAI